MKLDLVQTEEGIKYLLSIWRDQGGIVPGLCEICGGGCLSDIVHGGENLRLTRREGFSPART